MTTDEQQKTGEATSPEEGKEAPILENTNKQDAAKEKRDFLKILQIFSDLDTCLLRKMFDKCDRDFVKTIDNILFIKRYCVFLKLMKTHKETLNEPKVHKKNNISVSQTENQNNFAPVHYSKKATEMLLENNHINNNFASINRENNAERSYEKNYSYNLSQMYQSYNSSLRSLYDSLNSNISDPFYNSQDINSTQSSLYNNSNISAMYMPNGSVDGINFQLNNSLDTYGNNSYSFYDPFTNLPGNFRSSTPDIINIINDTFINQNL